MSPLPSTSTTSTLSTPSSIPTALQNQSQPYICAFPMSSQYSLPVRILLYTIVLLLQTPLSPTGLLTTLLTYIGVASIHSLAMASHTSPTVIDLDVYPTFFLCALGAFIIPSAVARAPKLRKASTLPVIVLFAIMAIIAVTLSPVRPSNLPNPIQCSSDSISKCIPTCSAETLALRSGQAAQVVVYPGSPIPSQRNIISGVLYAWCMSALILAATSTQAAKKKATANATAAASSQNSTLPRAAAELDPNGPAPEIHLTNSEPDYKAIEATADSLSPLHTPPNRSPKTSPKPNPVLHAISIFHPLNLLTLSLSTVWITLNELQVLRHLPQSERPDAIGQWGYVAAFALAGAAVLVRTVVERRGG